MMRKAIEYPHRSLPILGATLLFSTFVLSGVVAVVTLGNGKAGIHAATPTIDITSEAVQKTHQSAVPQTDINGNFQNSLNANSFFPIGIYNPTLCRVTQTLSWTAQPGYTGDYLVQVNYGNSSGSGTYVLAYINVGNVTSATVGNLPPNSGLYYSVSRKDNSTVIKQGPFTSGACASGDTQEDNNFQKIASAGFNTAILEKNYDPDTNVVSKAQGANLKLILDMRDHPDNTFSNLKDNSNVFGFYTGDDDLARVKATNGDPTSVYNSLKSYSDSLDSQTSKIILEAEPDIATADSNNSTWQTWYNKFDSVGNVSFHYNYPVAAGGINTIQDVANTVDHQIAQNGDSRPSWFIEQAINLKWLLNLDFPTPAQSKAMAYTALIHGATGLFQFSYDGWFRRQPKGSDAPQDNGSAQNYDRHAGVKDNTPISYAGGDKWAYSVSSSEQNASTTLWKSLDASQGGLNSQLNYLKPIILSKTATDDYKVYVDQRPTYTVPFSPTVSPAPIQTMLKKYMGNYYLMAVNVDNANINAKFTFPSLTFDRGSELFKGSSSGSTTYTYWVHDVGVTDSPGNPPNPSPVTTQTGYTFGGLTPGKTYTGVICSPDCGTVVWTKDVVADGSGRITLTAPSTPSTGGVLNGSSEIDATFAPFDVHIYKLEPTPPDASTSALVSYQLQVCSLLGNQQKNAGIYGQDGGTSVKIGDTSYWSFGDTKDSSGNVILPNNIATTKETNALNCLPLTPKTNGSAPADVLDPISGQEVTVWPDGMFTPDNSNGYFFYSSVKNCSAPEPCSWDQLGSLSVRGVGLAKFNTSTLDATRIGNCSQVTNCLFWQENDNSGFKIVDASAVLGQDGYLYVYLSESPDGINQNAMRLARVAVGSVENKSAYQYYNSDNKQWVGDIKNSTQIMTFPNAFNGASVSFNSYFNKWIAVFSTNNFNSVSLKYSPTPYGPWSNQEYLLFDCRGRFPNDSGLRCYSGREHPEFAQSGQLIFITYANEDSYQIYINRINLQNEACLTGLLPDIASIFAPVGKNNGIKLASTGSGGPIYTPPPCPSSSPASSPVPTPSPTPSPSPSPTPTTPNITLSGTTSCQSGKPYVNLSWTQSTGDTQFNINRDGSAITSSISTSWSGQLTTGETHTWSVYGIQSGKSSNSVLLTAPSCP